MSAACRRPQHPIWSLFDNKKFTVGQQKTLKVRCLQCKEAVTAAVARLKSHTLVCTGRQKSMIGLMDVVSQLTDHNKLSKIQEGKTKTLHTYVDRLSTDEKAELDRLFGDAIHRTATSFSQFEHVSWRIFFKKLRPVWIPPSPHTIGTTLLLASYADVMKNVFVMLRQYHSICFSLDGATNIQSKQVLNLMACVPKAFFCSTSPWNCAERVQLISLRS
jgi:hypothetical protein